MMPTPHFNRCLQSWQSLDVQKRPEGRREERAAKSGGVSDLHHARCEAQVFGRTGEQRQCVTVGEAMPCSGDKPSNRHAPADEIRTSLKCL